MYGDAAYGEAAYGEPQDNTIPPFQNRNVFAVLLFTAEAGGARTEPSSGAASFGFVASGGGSVIHSKVKTIDTKPKGGRGNTGLSHTGLN